MGLCDSDVRIFGREDAGTPLRSSIKNHNSINL
jgi:hypothetical protein